MKKQKGTVAFVLHLLAILLMLIIAAGMRWHAVVNLPVDYDEDDYIRAAQQFTALIRGGNWKGFLETNYRPEHPQLEKIAFGISLLSTHEETLIPDRPTTAGPDAYLSGDLLRPARVTSAVFGILEVVLLAIVNPLAGLFLGIHAFTIKYTSQVMLESLPALTSLACAMTYIGWKKRTSKIGNGWLISSAVFLGLTAASKYIFCVVGIAILIDWLVASGQSGNLSRSFPKILFWGALAFAVFLATNPYLWPDPVGRISESILYHSNYAAEASEVQDARYPIWQPFVWLSTTPYSWHPQAFYLAIDPLITLLAAIGIASLWKKQRVYVLWLGTSLFFLLIWPTKWPQYLLILTAPLSLSAAEGVMELTIRPLRRWLLQRKSKKKHESSNRRGDGRRALPWLIPGVIVFIILVLFPFFFQVGISLTDFSTASIKDGFNGGLWREIWGGLTGQVHAIPYNLGNSSPKVHYTGPAFYLPVLRYLTSYGILPFNILWMCLSVLFQTGLGLGVALLLWQKGIRFRQFWQTLLVLPWTIPEMIGALMWLNIFMPRWGWLALAVEKYGPHFPFAFFIGWEQNINLSLLVFLIPAVWYGFPFMMLASSAGLKLIPPEVLDAAAVDGASRWNMFRYVIWPLLLPLIIPAIIIRGIQAFNQFYLFQAFGSTDSTLATLSYNIFNPTGGTYGMRGGMFSVSAIINIITVVILAGFVILFSRWSKANEGVTYA